MTAQIAYSNICSRPQADAYSTMDQIEKSSALRLSNFSQFFLQNAFTSAPLLFRRDASAIPSTPSDLSSNENESDLSHFLRALQVNSTKHSMDFLEQNLEKLPHCSTTELLTVACYCERFLSEQNYPLVKKIIAVSNFTPEENNFIATLCALQMFQGWHGTVTDYRKTLSNISDTLNLAEGKIDSAMLDAYKSIIREWSSQTSIDKMFITYFFSKVPEEEITEAARQGIIEKMQLSKETEGPHVSSADEFHNLGQIIHLDKIAGHDNRLQELLDAKLRQLFKQGAESAGNFFQLEQFIKIFKPPAESYNTPETRPHFINLCQTILEDGCSIRIIHFLKEADALESFLAVEGNLNLFKRAAISDLAGYNPTSSSQFADEIEKIDSEFRQSISYQEAGVMGFIRNLNPGTSLDKIKEMRLEYHVNETILNSAKIQEYAVSCFTGLDGRTSWGFLLGSSEKSRELVIDSVLTERYQVAQALTSIMLNSKDPGYHSHVDHLTEKYLSLLPVDQGYAATDYAKTAIIMAENFDCKTFFELVNIAKKQGEYCFRISAMNSGGAPPLLTSETAASAQKLGLTWIEMEELLQGGFEIDFTLKELEKDHGKLLDALIKNCEDWSDGLEIVVPFSTAANFFGIVPVLKFTCPEGDETRHDRLNMMEPILKLHELSKLSGNQFYHQILEQVRMDSSLYGEQELSATQYLSSLKECIPEDLDDFLESCKQYQHLEHIQKFLEDFNPNDIWRSWRDLKYFGKLAASVAETQMLSFLNEGRQDKKNGTLCRFIETIGFHRGSNVPVSDLKMLWESPQRFFDKSDAHSADNIHDLLKPAAMTEHRWLDLKATDLRKAWIDGVIDRLQILPALQMKMKVPVGLAADVSVRDGLSVALGDRILKIPGKSIRPTKLFKEVSKILSPLSINEYISGEKKPAPEVENQIAKLLLSKDTGMPLKTADIIAEMHFESDPTSILAGNDTACCMNFGSGKRNVYTFNKALAVFTLGLKTSEGNYRTISQSLTRVDRNLGTPVSKVRRAITNETSDYTDILPDWLNLPHSFNLSLDNVEVSSNYRSGHYPFLIHQCYSTFFQEYLKRFGESLNLEQTFLPIGCGYSPTMKHLDTAPNTYAPALPLGYTDMGSEEVYCLALLEYQPFASIEEVSAHTTNQNAEIIAGHKKERRGVTKLDSLDWLPVMKLEREIYPDAEVGLSALSTANMLQAIEINDELKNRPDLCFKYCDKNGEMQGYLVAYEGREEDFEHEDPQDNPPVIYIEDLAVKNPASLTGAFLLRHFIKVYKREYLDKDNPVPIETELREGTSYELVKKGLNTINRLSGVKCLLDEGRTEYRGEEVFHHVRLKQAD